MSPSLIHIEEPCPACSGNTCEACDWTGYVIKPRRIDGVELTDQHRLAVVYELLAECVKAPRPRGLDPVVADYWEAIERRIAAKGANNEH